MARKKASILHPRPPGTVWHPPMKCRAKGCRVRLRDFEALRSHMLSEHSADTGSRTAGASRGPVRRRANGQRDWSSSRTTLPSGSPVKEGDVIRITAGVFRGQEVRVERIDTPQGLAIVEFLDIHVSVSVLLENLWGPQR